MTPSTITVTLNPEQQDFCNSCDAYAAGVAQGMNTAKQILLQQIARKQSEPPKPELPTPEPQRVNGAMKEEPV
jgi:hypothetical protein